MPSVKKGQRMLAFSTLLNGNNPTLVVTVLPTTGLNNPKVFAL